MLADHGFGNGGGLRLGEGKGLASAFFSSFSCCRISVRLGPCVVSWLLWLMIMTVSGLVVKCMVNSSCTRGVPVNCTLPVAAVSSALLSRTLARLGGFTVARVRAG